MSSVTNPFKDNSAIQILLIRDAKLKDHDDKIAIKYDEMMDSYTVSYVDSNTVAKRVQSIELDGDTLDTYLKSLFTLLSNDQDPFVHVQFNIPAMPSILFNAKQLTNAAIVDSLMGVMPITNGMTY